MEKGGNPGKMGEWESNLAAGPQRTGGPVTLGQSSALEKLNGGGGEVGEPVVKAETMPEGCIGR